MRAVLRRGGAARPDDDRPLAVGGLVVDPAGASVTVDDRPVDLTATEFDLLAHMAAAPERVFTRSQLLEALHGVAVDAGLRAIDAHVKNLRRKIEPDPHRPRRLAHGARRRLPVGGAVSYLRRATPAGGAGGSCSRGPRSCRAIWIAVGVVFGVHRGPRPTTGPRAAAGRTRSSRRSSAPRSSPRSSPTAGWPGRWPSCSRAPSASVAATTAPASDRRAAAVRTLGRSFNDMAGRLDASEASRRRFLADVTHELRTPLTVLQAEIEAQLDGIHPRDDAHLEMLLDQTRTLDRLVEDLRTLALGDAGRLALHREPVPIGVLVADAVAAIAPSAAPPRDRGAAAPAPDVELDVDPVRIGQVLGNLLTNAVRHTPPRRSRDGRPRTAATRRGRIAVTDDGPGHRRRSRAAVRPLPRVRRLRRQRARADDRPPARRGPRRHAHRGQRARAAAPASRSRSRSTAPEPVCADHVRDIAPDPSSAGPAPRKLRRPPALQRISRET